MKLVLRKGRPLRQKRPDSIFKPITKDTLTFAEERKRDRPESIYTPVGPKTLTFAEERKRAQAPKKVVAGVKPVRITKALKNDDKAWKKLARKHPAAFTPAKGPDPEAKSDKYPWMTNTRAAEWKKNAPEIERNMAAGTKANADRAKSEYSGSGAPKPAKSTFHLGPEITRKEEMDHFLKQSKKAPKGASWRPTNFSMSQKQIREGIRKERESSAPKPTAKPTQSITAKPPIITMGAPTGRGAGSSKRSRKPKSNAPTQTRDAEVTPPKQSSPSDTSKPTFAVPKLQTNQPSQMDAFKSLQVHGGPGPAGQGRKPVATSNTSKKKPVATGSYHFERNLTDATSGASPKLPAGKKTPKNWGVGRKTTPTHEVSSERASSHTRGEWSSKPGEYKAKPSFSDRDPGAHVSKRPFLGIGPAKGEKMDPGYRSGAKKPWQKVDSSGKKTWHRDPGVHASQKRSSSIKRMAAMVSPWHEKYKPRRTTESPGGADVVSGATPKYKATKRTAPSSPPPSPSNTGSITMGTPKIEKPGKRSSREAHPQSIPAQMKRAKEETASATPKRTEAPAKTSEQSDTRKRLMEQFKSLEVVKSCDAHDKESPCPPDCPNTLQKKDVMYKARNVQLEFIRDRRG